MGLNTKIGVTFHIKNVGNQPVTFVSETSRQDDRIDVTNAVGENVKVAVPFYTGFPIDVRWTLKPGEIAKLRVLDPAHAHNRTGRDNTRFVTKSASTADK